MSPKVGIYMRRAVLVSLSCNVVLFIIKAVALIVVNSLAIAMDLGITVVGLIVSIILYYSVKLAVKPADLIHNYGYGKVEHVCEAMEGVVLIGIALAMSSQALLSILHPKHVEMPWVGLVSCTVNVFLNFGGAWYISKMAKKSASPAIHAEGLHFRLEGFISAMIAGSFLLSIFLRGRGLSEIVVHIDPVTALLVSLVVIVPSFKLAKAAFFKLLDSSVEEDSQIEILKHLGHHIAEYCEFRDIKSRTAGQKKFVEFKIVVPEEISFKKGHTVIATLEDDIKQGIPDSEIMIKMEPCDKDCSFVANNEQCPYL